MSEFFGEVYHDNDLRRQDRRALSRDVALYVRNRLCAPAEAALREAFEDPDLPVVFLVGAPRSGTTLLFQLLARGLAVTYPTNAVARWFSAPLVGSLLHGPKPWSRPRDIPLRSRYGGTEGPDAPHEFSWFWRYHVPAAPTDDRTPAQLDQISWGPIRRTLSAMAGMAGRPLVLKSLNWTVYHIERFARELPQARFLHIHRQPRYVVQSILRCRRERYGDERLWWTIRPRDVERWRPRDPVEQVCHQVLDIRAAIERDMARLARGRGRTIAYEELVEAPERALRSWASWLGTGQLDGPVAAPQEVRSGNRRTCAPERMDAIDACLQRLS